MVNFCLGEHLPPHPSLPFFIPSLFLPLPPTSPLLFLLPFPILFPHFSFPHPTQKSWSPRVVLEKFWNSRLLHCNFLKHKIKTRKLRARTPPPRLNCAEMTHVDLLIYCWIRLLIEISDTSLDRPLQQGDAAVWNGKSSVRRCWVFFQFLVLYDPEANDFQNLIVAFLSKLIYVVNIFVKIRSVVLSKVAKRQTDKQTNAGYYITSFADVVKEQHWLLVNNDVNWMYCRLHFKWVCGYVCDIIYTVSQKNWAIFIFTVTLSNIDRF